MMSKRARDEDPIERARRKLARAQLKLHVAEDEQVQVRAKGKQEVEQARLRAAHWQAKAAERVEKRVSTVARAEARLEKVQTPAEKNSSPVSAADTVEVLQNIEDASLMAVSNGVLLPESLSPQADEARVEH